MNRTLEPSPLQSCAQLPLRLQEDSALCALLTQLNAQAYEFISPSPLTHSRVLANRNQRVAKTLRDLFGWSLPFSLKTRPEGLSDPLLEAMQCAKIVEALAPTGEAVEQDLYRSKIRVSSFEEALFLHSAYPTIEQDTVFFGPDTYRFLRLIQSNMPVHNSRYPPRVLDIGCGSGAAGLIAKRLCPGAQIVFNDINSRALQYAAANAQAAAVQAQFALGDSLAAVTGTFDVILCNPPYLVDDKERAYRHGGADLGRALGVRIATQALQRLRPLGRLIMYTGVAMVEGKDPFIEALRPALAEAACVWTYSEIDPDVFSEELMRPVYGHVDRICAVGLVAVKA